MDKNTPEVWVEVNGKKKESVLIGKFYREMAMVRGRKAIEGTAENSQQKERLQTWTRKIREQINKEEKTICFGGDFNAHISGEHESTKKNDAYGKILEEELIEAAGMTMVVKDTTHQEVRKGIKCKARRIDHIYCNSPEKTKRHKEYQKRQKSP